MSDVEIKKCLLTKNDCYKKGRTIKPEGIIVHSTGANNPTLKRYVQPDDGILGKNANNNDWNRSGLDVCVHAFIGKDKNGKVRVYQTLPWDHRCWGCGAGKNGSYNNNYIQFEICEDALKDKEYFEEAFKAAAELCKFLMNKYGIKSKNVISHHEAYLRGYASGHVDCDHWLKKFNKDMDWFRAQLVAPAQKVEKSYKVKVTADTLNIRSGPGTKNKAVGKVKKNEVYTIVETDGNWGKLKSGAGWICLKYTKKV